MEDMLYLLEKLLSNEKLRSEVIFELEGEELRIRPNTPKKNQIDLIRDIMIICPNVSIEIQDEKIRLHLEGQDKQDKNNQLVVRVTEIIKTLGIPANLAGYKYIRDAVIMVINDIEILNNVTKKLYPELAKKYGSTSTRVERAIRNSIEMAWSRGNIEVHMEMFGETGSNKKGRPTNSEFIAMVTDNILLKHK